MAWDPVSQGQMTRVRVYTEIWYVAVKSLGDEEEAWLLWQVEEVKVGDR